MTISKSIINNIYQVLQYTTSLQQCFKQMHNVITSTRTQKRKELLIVYLYPVLCFVKWFWTSYVIDNNCSSSSSVVKWCQGSIPEIEKSKFSWLINSGKNMHVIAKNMDQMCIYLSCPAVSQISNFTIVESSSANVCDKKDAPTVTCNHLGR
jgi:hypothetical protein